MSAWISGFGCLAAPTPVVLGEALSRRGRGTRGGASCSRNLVLSELLGVCERDEGERIEACGSGDNRDLEVSG